jgi:hypothetical protein
MVENVDYQAVLADLKARRARLEGIIAGIEAEILGQAESVADQGAIGVAAPVVTATIHPDTFFGLSYIEGAKKYLKMVRRAQHTTAIADALAKGGLKRPQEGTLSSLLIRAAKGREVMKVGKAMWGLAEWYPKTAKDANGEVTRKAQGKSGRKRSAPSKPQPKGPGPAKAAAAASPKETAAPTNGAGLGVSELIRTVLREADKPLRVQEITERVSARGYAGTRNSVEGVLYQWVKKGKVKRTAPGTFSLD